MTVKPRKFGPGAGSARSAWADLLAPAILAHGDKVGQLKTPRKVRPTRKLMTQDTEHNQQVVFVNRARTLAMNDKRYAIAASRLHAIPNGGGRSKGQAGRLKAEGVLGGVSDTFTAYPVPGFHGLYIEMKSKIGKLDDAQKEWIDDSNALGYSACCCWSADEAFDRWKAYVELGFGQEKQK